MIAFHEFGAETTRIGTDLIGLEDLVLTRARALPHLEHLFALEDAHDHALGRRGAHVIERLHHGRSQRDIVPVIAALDEVGTGREAKAQPEDDDDGGKAMKKAGSHDQGPKSAPWGSG
ncbi:hypothetical protein D3C86_1817590 [compost metagenome]